MNINKLTPAPQEKDKVKFDLRNYHKVPQESGCYVITTYEENILYIGKSVNINDRFKQHLDDPKKTGATSKGLAFWFHWLEWDKTQLNALEGGWANFYKATEGERPIMNLIDPPV